MKRTGVDCATAAISGKELGKCGMKVIGDEGGDDVFITIRNDEKVAGTNCIKVVLPSGTWVNPWLGAIGTGSPSFYVSVHGFGLYCVSFGLLV